MAKKKKEYKDLKVNQAVTAENSLPTQFKRSRWKHFLRLFIFGVICMLYILFAWTAFHTHVVLHQGFHPKEGLALFLGLIIALPVFPSVILEADTVTIEPSGIVIKNLLFKNKEAWEDIKSFINPIYLKFSILKGKKFVYLLNRRDLSDYDQLVETIEQKAVQLKTAEIANTSDGPK
ncbi:MAG: hypothetical protein K2X77_24870 [Candidatus Obscuribacterales bacterium]|jgi:hypothetical protein|nr:hypothetical protein [Candidatus Obscuribacterales bacterium]